LCREGRGDKLSAEKEEVPAMLSEAVVTDIITRNYNVKSFRFPRPEDLFFRAGQFLQVTLPINGADQSKYFSFSNAPAEQGHIEFTKKMTGSEFSKALENLRVGDKVRLKMPLGAFVLDETAPKQAFLSGGIGITPIRSMLKDAFDRRLPFDRVLFYSNRSPEDIIFREELEAMAQECKELKVVFSLDTTEACPAGWKGKCGFISAAMIREELPDYAERIFYVCGPPGMVKSLVSILQNELKIPAAKIKIENFAGY
jgi:ferredoxin-NADP reductase